MKRPIQIVAVLVAVALVAGAVSELAARNIRPGERTRIIPKGPIKDPYSPGSTTRSNGDGSIGFSAKGMVAHSGPAVMAGNELIGMRGSAIVAPTGGSVYTPRERAQRDIRRVIRQLD